MALVERGGRVRTRVIANVTGRTLKAVIRANVDRQSTIFADQNRGYRGIGREFAGGHKSVNHSKGEYARPDGTTTNTVESHFALLKRGVIGTFHRVSRKHLQRYCDEFDFRWNHRKLADVERTKEALRHIEGKRLTYYEAMPEAG